MALADGVKTRREERRFASFNPLRCSGTALPPQVLLAAKIIVLGLLLKGYVQRIPGVFVPLWPAFDLLPRPELVQPLMQTIVAVCGVMLLCNRAVRFSAMAVGSTLLLSTLAARAFYSNGRLFCSSMLILIGLYVGARSIWPIRWQVVVLYLGSGLNKITQADWRSGRYFENWMHNILEHDGYTRLAAAMPPMALSQFFCWATIVTELAIATGLAVPRWYRVGIWLALLFHFSSVALTGTMFGIFVIAVTFSLLVFVEWPARREVIIVRGGRQGLVGLALRLAERFDFDEVLDFSRPMAVQQHADDKSVLVVRWRDKSYWNYGAVMRIALSLPVTYFMAALVLILPSVLLRQLGL